MHIPLFLILFVGLSIIYLIVGLTAGKEHHNQEDYFLAGRKVGLWPLTMTLVATQIGGGMLLGTAQAAYEHGMLGILYTTGMALGFILLGIWFAPRMRAFNADTNAHVLEIAYGSRKLRQIASAISVMAMVGLLIGQIVATRSIFVSLGLTHWWLVPLSWAIVLLYTLFGGLSAVVATDIVQALVIMIIFSGILIHHWYTQADPWLHATKLFDFGELYAFGPQTIYLLLMPALFSLVEQDLAQRFFSAKSAKIASRAAWFSAGIIVLFALIPVFFGLLARQTLPGLPEGASPLLPLFETIGGPVISAIALCALAAAIVSTSDSLLCAASSNVAQDFCLIPKGVPEVHYSQLVTAAIGIIALLSSYRVPQNILQILVGSYALSVNTLLVPLVAAYCLHKPNLTSAWCALLSGGISMCIIFARGATQYNWIPIIISALTYALHSCMRPQKRIQTDSQSTK